MNNKGIARSAIAIVIIIIIIAAGIGAYLAIRPVGKPAGEIWVAMVTGVGGRGDLSFIDMGARGCDIALEEGIIDKFTLIVSTTPDDWIPNLTEVCSSGDYDLMIPIGYELWDATETVAQEYPQQNIATMDYAVTVQTPGLLGYVFMEEQSGALGGALAGLIAAAHEKPYIGIVLGQEMPPVWRYEIGFKWGVDWAIGDGGWYENRFGEPAPSIGTVPVKERIIYDYTETFEDPALGKITAEAQLAHDLAVCWAAAGATGLGVFDAVEEYHTAHNIPKSVPPFIEGVDADQDWMKPGLVIGSPIKRVDLAALHACQLAAENTFKEAVSEHDGVLLLGITDNATGISNLEMLDDFIQFGVAYEELTGESVLPASAEEIRADVTAMVNAQPAWVWEGVSELEDKIRSGEITVPRASDRDTTDYWRDLLG